MKHIGVQLILLLVGVFTLLSCATTTVAALSLFRRAQRQQEPKKKQLHPKDFDFDLIILGAGASGLFASGAAASLFGKRTCLIEKREYAGGDCTNAACVPSKALRSFAALSSGPRRGDGRPRSSLFLDCQQYVYDTVLTVRERENLNKDNDTQEGDPGLLSYRHVKDCHFVDRHTLYILNPNNTATHVTSRQFLIATGAAPVIPDHLEQSAASAGIHLTTYQSLLRPESRDLLWSMLGDAVAAAGQAQNSSSNSATPTFRLLVAGGGATACELAQNLGRLTYEHKNSSIQIILVAPALLPQEDVKLQEAAYHLLRRAGVEWFPGRVADFGTDRSVRIQSATTTTNSTTATLPPVDAALLCLGRSPAASLQSLQLERAGAEWSRDAGVLVHPHSLQSVSTRSVYAAGDCCSAVGARQRTASQAAWTGFHAVRNLCLPSVLRLGDRASVHAVIPRVVYTDPEMACVGWTYAECVRRYGLNGFDCMSAREEGTDRADMERCARDTSSCFVELRANRQSGRILGCTACGPAAAELTNSMGIAITNGLTVSNVAFAAHSYPSYGYLLYRVALAMALGSVWGALEACGPVGKMCVKAGRRTSSSASLARHAIRLPRKRNHLRRLWEWQAEGVSRGLLFRDTTLVHGECVRLVSYLEVSQNATMQTDMEECLSEASVASHAGMVKRNDAEKLLQWLRSEP